MNKKIRLLKEDETKIYNQWVAGIAKREGPPEVITQNDIVNQYRNRRDGMAPKKLPAPFDSLVERIGDIFIKTAELRNSLRQTDDFPLLNKQSEKRKAVLELNKKLESIQEIIYTLPDTLNKLVD